MAKKDPILGNKNTAGKVGGVRRSAPHLLPALRPTGVSPRVYTVNYLLRETQVKFEGFLTIKEWVSSLFPLCWMGLFAAPGADAAPFLYSITLPFLPPLTQGHLGSSFLS